MDLKFRIFDGLVMYDMDPWKEYCVLSPKGRSIEVKKVGGARFTPPLFEPDAKFFMAITKACKSKRNRDAVIVAEDSTNKVGAYFVRVKKGMAKKLSRARNYDELISALEGKSRR